MKSSFVRRCFLLAVAACWIAPAAAQAKASKVTIILDASGSMWAKLHERWRIDHAKQVLGKIIDGAPRKTRLGLVIYGHRRKKDCKDVELVALPGALKRPLLKQRIQGIKPRGQTPLALSITRTVKALKGRPGPHTVLLVTDGIETCGGDPCRVVRELRRSGIAFTMHVVGFGVKATDLPQLNCIARAGGGQYRTAKDGAQLAVAIGRAVEQPHKRPHNLEVGAYRNGKRFRAVVNVYRASTAELVDYGQCDEHNSARFGLAPGSYDIEADDLWGSKVKRRLKRITVSKRGIVKKRVDFDLGTLKLVVVRGDKPMKVSVTLYRSGSKKQEASQQTGSEGVTRFSVLPGHYDAQVADPWRSKTTLWVRGITVRGGTTVNKRVVFTLGTLSFKVTHKGKPWKAIVTVFKAGTKTVVRDQQNGSGGGCSFLIAPGRYDVKVYDPWGLKREVWLRGVTVKQDRTVQRTVPLD
jgi:Ca-activated chloride channel family protein